MSVLYKSLENRGAFLSFLKKKKKKNTHTHTKGIGQLQVGTEPALNLGDKAIISPPDPSLTTGIKISVFCYGGGVGTK
jgi:hypothetical protein